MDSGKSSEVFDEEALTRDFEEPESVTQVPTPVQLERPDFNPARFAELVCHTLDHPDFRALPSHQQILYLQFLRHSHGCGTSRIKASISDIAQWAGTRGKNALRTRQQLVSAGLLKITVRPRQFLKGQFEVRLFSRQIRHHISPDTMIHRFHQFTVKDLEILDSQIRTAEPEVRESLLDDTRQLLADMKRGGFEIPPETETKIYKYLAFVRLTGRWRITSRFKDWDGI
ncbi:MAG: hypothetical protein MRJ68_17640 [Nitrospira sp.]|nr:hypothetical protein [Nitrospira sp.]